MSFVHRYDPTATPNVDDRVIVVQGDRLLLPSEADDQHPIFPKIRDLQPWAAARSEPTLLGTILGARHWFVLLDDAQAEAPAGCGWQETRSLLAAFPPAELNAVYCARQLGWWQMRNRFCGCCGSPTIHVAGERAKRCPRCNASFFPSASPAVIVAITRGDQILLAHNRNFRPGMFSLLAGFVDAGETLEQAVVREVREEVSLEIGDLRYVKSQPWPFPNSLMLAFRARYVSGELRADGTEIEEAGWFSRDALPEIPRVGSVARALIDSWCAES